MGIIGLKDNEVRTFFVDPGQQRKGIGYMLYMYLEQIVRNRGITKIIVTSSLIGERAYMKYGFKKIGTYEKEYEGIKYTDAYMEKYLFAEGRKD